MNHAPESRSIITFNNGLRYTEAVAYQAASEAVSEDGHGYLIASIRSLLSSMSYRSSSTPCHTPSLLSAFTLRL